MFGKKLSQYLGFQKVVLATTAVVGLARLGLSLAGLPNSAVTFLSITVVGLAAAVYYGVSVYRSGFGSYKQLLPLAIFQALVMHAVSVLGILLTIAGMPNIFAAPEYSGPAVTNQWLHAVAHLTIGMIALPLVLWAVASLTMLITKKVARRPAALA
jgi:hypothetical protein